MKITYESHVTVPRRFQMYSIAAYSAIMALVLIAAAPGAAIAAREKPLEMIFIAADSDGNGQISENEWHTAMQNRFNDIDLNADGQISHSEMEKSRESVRRKLRDLRSSKGGTFGN